MTSSQRIWAERAPRSSIETNLILIVAGHRRCAWSLAATGDFVAWSSWSDRLQSMTRSMTMCQAGGCRLFVGCRVSRGSARRSVPSGRLNPCRRRCCSTPTSADQSLPARSRPGPLPIGVSLRPGLGAFDEPFSCGAAGERSFLFARPPVSGELGAAFVASPVERVPIARRQLAAGPCCAGRRRTRDMRCGLIGSTRARPWWVRRRSGRGPGRRDRQCRRTRLRTHRRTRISPRGSVMGAAGEARRGRRYRERPTIFADPTAAIASTGKCPSPAPR